MLVTERNGRLRTVRDGMLYMTTGASNGNAAQEGGSLRGKILRLRDDGTTAPGNPFAGKPGYKSKFPDWKNNVLVGAQLGGTVPGYPHLERLVLNQDWDETSRQACWSICTSAFATCGRAPTRWSMAHP